MLNLKALKEAALRATCGPWSVGGARQKIDRQEAHGIFWYDEHAALSKADATS